MKIKPKDEGGEEDSRGSGDEMDDGLSEDSPSCGMSAVAKTPLNHPRGEPRQNRAGRRLFLFHLGQRRRRIRSIQDCVSVIPPARYPRRPASLSLSLSRAALKMVMRVRRIGASLIWQIKPATRSSERQMYQQPHRQICLLVRGRLGPSGMLGVEDMRRPINKHDESAVEKDTM